MKKSYRDYVNSGICPACKSKPHKEGIVLCERCWAYRMRPERKAKQNEMRDRYIANNRKLGLCDRCKNKRVEGRTECQKCIDQTIVTRRARKKKVIDLYGGKCNCCGEDTIEFLTVDHVNGGGAKERKSGFQIHHLRGKLLKEGKPNPEYQVLCMNCNFSKGMYGYCPHQSRN